MSETRRCGQHLYENGKLIAVCVQPFGIEHDHSDKTAKQAIAAGLAMPIEAEAEQVSA